MLQQRQGHSTVSLMRMAGMAFLLIVTLGCTSSWHAVPPGLQIVLTNQHGVFLAEWRGGDLDPQLLTDFKGGVTLYILATSAAHDVIGVAGWASETRRSTFYFIDPATGTSQKVFEADGVNDVLALASEPGRQAVAFIGTMSGEGVQFDRDVLVYDLRARRARAVVRRRAFLALSWKPGSDQLTYDTRDGWIESVTLKTQRIERLVQGGGPAWSPDGTKLAYHREGRFFLFDPARGTSHEVGGSAERLPIFGRLHWSPDGRYISTNAEWNYLGLLKERCVVVEVASGKKFVVQCAGLASGPWLAKN